MLKINKASEFNEGYIFQLRNAWREKIAKHINKDAETLPFQYKIIGKNGSEYLCESVESKKTYKLYVTETLLKYITCSEVTNSNIGMYFNDYLPNEDTSLLLSDNKDILSVYPMIFKFDVSVQNEILKIDLILENILTHDKSELNKHIKKSWKYLHETDEYMTDVEKMFKDTFVHKEFVVKACNKFSKYLKDNGYEQDAEELKHRAEMHDNSKILNKDEFRALTGIINDKSCLRDASSKLSSFKQDAIELHWKHNSHHPEHFSNISEMGKMDKIEMVCDWYARSQQYGTDLISFVEQRQTDRFHFPELMYSEIMHYCKIITQI